MIIQSHSICIICLFKRYMGRLTGIINFHLVFHFLFFITFLEKTRLGSLSMSATGAYGTLQLFKMHLKLIINKL